MNPVYANFRMLHRNRNGHVPDAADNHPGRVDMRNTPRYQVNVGGQQQHHEQLKADNEVHIPEKREFRQRKILQRIFQDPSSTEGCQIQNPHHRKRSQNLQAMQRNRNDTHDDRTHAQLHYVIHNHTQLTEQLAKVRPTGLHSTYRGP